MSDPEILFGFQEEWSHFRERNPRLELAFPRLNDLRSAVFDRQFTSSEPIDRFVMLYGRMCMEEFYEILLMCGNGYGVGGQKLLRAFWEKAVTLEYLIRHPDELDDFVDYHHVTDYKLFNSVREIIGPDALPEAIVSENAAEYERVKERFMIKTCKVCGTKRVNHNWNNLDVVSMSRQTRILGKIVNEAYYIPMRHTHSTSSSFVMRLENTDSGALSFNPDPQRREADSALRTAYLIVLEILEMEIGFYKFEHLREALAACEQDWRDIYSRRPDAS
jgi:hypothetical protein